MIYLNYNGDIAQLFYLVGVVSVFERLRSQHIIGRLNVYGLVALAGILGPIVLGIADLTAGLSEPGYNPIRDSISSLALTPMGWLQTVGFLTVGLLAEVFVVGLFFSIKRGRNFGISAAILVCFGFGLLLIGAFRTDPIGTSHTIEGTIHHVTAVAVFWLFPIACLLLAPSLKKDPHWQNLFIYTIIASALALVFMIVQIWLPTSLSWFGLYERILVWNTVIWIEVMAIQLLRLSLLR